MNISLICRCGGGNDDPMELDPGQEKPEFSVYRCVTCSHEVVIEKRPAERTPRETTPGDDGRATALLITVVCPVCEFSGSGLPYHALGTVTCESCGHEFGVRPDAITDAQHALLVALGEAEPVQA